MKVLACIEWDDATQSCAVQAWVEQPGLWALLPTVEEASYLGGLMMLSLFSVAALKYLLKPQKEIIE